MFHSIHNKIRAIPKKIKDAGFFLKPPLFIFFLIVLVCSIPFYLLWGVCSLIKGVWWVVKKTLHLALFILVFLALGIKDVFRGTDDAQKGEEVPPTQDAPPLSAEAQKDKEVTPTQNTPLSAEGADFVGQLNAVHAGIENLSCNVAKLQETCEEVAASLKQQESNRGETSRDQIDRAKEMEDNISKAILKLGTQGSKHFVAGIIMSIPVTLGVGLFQDHINQLGEEFLEWVEQKREELAGTAVPAAAPMHGRSAPGPSPVQSGSISGNKTKDAFRSGVQPPTDSGKSRPAHSRRALASDSG